MPSADDSENRSNERPSPSWMKRVPMVTGVLAGLAGFLTVKSANMSDQAIYNSTQAVLHQSRASDKWAEYQADSVKRHIDETAIKTATTNPTVIAELKAEAKSLKDIRQIPESVDARSEESQRDEELVNGRQRLAQKDLLDYAGVGAQLGIALASVAALTRRKAAFTAGVVIGLFAVVITAYAIISPYYHYLDAYLHRH